jgi:hypothetical protein
VHSIDLGHTETFTSFRELLDYRDPVSPFALPKASLALVGLDGGRAEGATLEDVLDELGAGLEITLLCAVPKGSGLGTSSVLGGVILAALSRFFGLPLLQDELVRQVLQVEQMLTTGGGWQDQIGGLLPGVKYVERAGRGYGRTRSCTSSTRSSSRTGRAWAASRSSTRASRGSRRTSWPTWWTG